MRRWSMAVATVALTVGACGEQRGPTEAGRDTRAVPQVSTQIVSSEGGYPTEEEWLAAGGSSSNGVWITDMKGAFSGDSKSFTGSGTAHFRWLNDVSAAIATSIINTNGNTVNSGGRSYGSGNIIPGTVFGDTTLTSTISTNNHTCGVTGKASMVAKGALWVLVNSSLTRVWHREPTDEIDVTLAPCEVHETTCRVGRFDVPLCPDDGGPSDGGGEGDGVPGGGGGGDETPRCTLWQVIVWVSYDGGLTREIIDVYYFVECS